MTCSTFNKAAIILALTVGWHAAPLAATPTDSPDPVDPSVVSEAAGAEVSQAAQSTEQNAKDSDSGWEVSVTPYLWGTGLKSQVTTRQGEKANVDKSFFDVLKVFKFGFFGVLNARKGRFVTVHDFIYLDVGPSARGPAGFVKARLDSKTFLSTHLVGYRVLDRGPLFLDLLGGARVTALDADLTLTGPVRKLKRNNSLTNVGPVLATRFRAPLGGRWSFAAYGDVGGFGVNSAHSWQLLGNIQYELSRHWRVAAGWRHVKASASKERFDIDFKLDGPITGVTYTF
jgi:hypothetical protein